MRNVAGCVPLSLEPTCRVLLITSRKHPGQWILPKGGVDSGESIHMAAVRETYEEAGVPMDGWKWINDEPRILVDVSDSKNRFVFYGIQVTADLLESWPEQHQRERRWFDADEATQVCQRPLMVEAIREAVLSFQRRL